MASVVPQCSIWTEGLSTGRIDDHRIRTDQLQSNSTIIHREMHIENTLIKAPSGQTSQSMIRQVSLQE